MTIRLPNDFTSSLLPFCSATLPIATSIIPPLAALCMNVLSFALTDELLLAGLSSATARPAKLIDASTRARTPNREITVSLLFIIFFVETYRNDPTPKNRKFTPKWPCQFGSDLNRSPHFLGAGLTQNRAADQAWEIFCLYELSTRFATSL